MTDKELKNLNRAELLELLIEVSKENDELKNEIALLKKKLTNKEIKINRCGSIAEASIAVNGVFEAAERAAAQYIENIKAVNDKCVKMRAKAQADAEKIIADAEQKAKIIIKKAKNEAEKIS